MVETVVFNQEKDEFEIESTEGYGVNRTITYKSLTERGWVKNILVYALIVREIPNEDFNNPIKKLTYKLPIQYSILDNSGGKYKYIKSETRAFDIPIRNNPRADLIGLYVKDMETGICQELPMPNKNFVESDFGYLKISKKDAEVLATVKQIQEVIKTKRCIGFFSYDMQNRL